MPYTVKSQRTDRDLRSSVEGLAPTSKGGLARNLLGPLVLGLVVFGLGSWLFKSISLGTESQARIAALAVSVVAFLVVVWRSFKQDHEFFQRLEEMNREVEEDLRSGELEVVSFEPEAILQIGIGPEERVKYCYRLDAGHYLVLREDDLPDNEIPWHGFLSSSIELSRLPHSGVIVSLSAQGEELEPVGELPADIDEYSIDSGTVQDAPWEEVAAGRVSF